MSNVVTFPGHKVRRTKCKPATPSRSARYPGAPAVPPLPNGGRMAPEFVEAWRQRRAWTDSLPLLEPLQELADVLGISRDSYSKRNGEAKMGLLRSAIMLELTDLEFS